MDFLKKILNSRVLITVIAMALQLFVLIGVILKFNDYFAFFYVGSILVSLVVVLAILNNRSNPVYKIAWIIPILIFPIFGGLFYIFFGVGKLSERRRHSMNSITEKTKEICQPRQEIIDEIEAQNEDAAFQSRYIQNYSCFPPYKQTFSEYLPIGELKFERLKEELKKAQRFIFLEYFIIEEGIMWNSILEILTAKVKQGVDVRVIYDDFGCLVTLPYNYQQQLEEMGIKCYVFNPVVPILTSRINSRDHRKITVIDGRVAFTGGINLADEYINAIQKFGHWKDAAIMIKGEAVWSLTVMFLTMWSYLSGKYEDINQFKIRDTSQDNHPDQDNHLDQENHPDKDRNDGYIQPFADSPIDDEPVGETIYFNLINKSRKYVYITTPYLILNNEMITALLTAAKGGVDVRIITPHISDKWYVHIVTHSYYRILIEGGVKIYEYAPGFIHSKTLVADDEYGIVGTINMDYRSLFLHFECGIWIYKSKSIQDMKGDFLNTLKECHKVTIREIKKTKWYKALVGSILRVFAPLM